MYTQIYNIYIYIDPISTRDTAAKSSFQMKCVYAPMWASYTNEPQKSAQKALDIPTKPETLHKEVFSCQCCVSSASECAREWLCTTVCLQETHNRRMV